MSGFLNFIKTHGIMGLAIGFIIGGAAQQFVSALSKDILSPIVGKAMGSLGDLNTASSTIYGMTFGWGHFLSEFINLILVALIVYIIVSSLIGKNLEEKKKEV